MQPDKPWFLYLCPGAPLTAPVAARVAASATAARFDQGWGAWRQAAFERQLAEGSARGTELSASRLGAGLGRPLRDQRRVSARYMEVLRRLPVAPSTTTSAACSTASRRPASSDDTLVMVISDNRSELEAAPTARSATPATGTWPR